MSRTPLIVVLALALLLGGALLLTRPAPNTPAGTNSTPIAPSSVVLDARTVRIDGSAFTRTSGRWADATGFPIDPARMTTLMRELASAQGTPAEGTIDQGVTITIANAAGDEATLLLDRTAFGGVLRLRADSGEVLETDASLLAALSGASTGGWRVRDPLAGVDAAKLTALTLDSPQHSFRASRTGPTWSVTSPRLSAPVRGHVPALRAIPAMLGSVRIERVLQTPEPINGTETLLHATFSSGDDTHTLTIGPPAGVGTDERLGLVRFAGSEGFGVVLTGFDPSAVPTDPLVYTARTAVGPRTRPSDVRTLRIQRDTSEHTYTRALEEWQPSDASEVVPAGEIDALLSLFTQTNGIPGVAADSEFEALALVTLIGYDDGVLETLEAGVAGGVFAVRNGPLVWAFPDAVPPRVLRMVPAATE